VKETSLAICEHLWVVTKRLSAKTPSLLVRNYLSFLEMREGNLSCHLGTLTGSY
jgi:hypothetical protein